MKIGSNVVFQEKEYTIVWLYNNGKCEIKARDASGEIKLVSLSELQVSKKTPDSGNLMFS
ncbi:hypothetical protein A3863_04770 [Priestia endophytica]|uniref:hypothetical protein n=1 Tax=Priestia endophytica TaxID=135735 RepID=UPI000DCA620A|nr:hypothetical protein [Priestia endophytica]RAS91795.1 hypothetical protein A3863_04770 [Priestia endophytica]